MKNADNAHPIDTRERLILAAVQVFASKNFEGASIREIARMAEANSALIQYHFGGKEGLYLAAVQFVFKMGSTQFDTLPPLPDPTSPGAREEALQTLRAFIRTMVWLTCTCTCPACMSNHYGPEVEQAAYVFWSQAVQTLRPSVLEAVKEMITPLTGHLKTCIQILRPDLSVEDCFRMEMSTLGQITHINTHRGLVELQRGALYSEAELDSLVEHFFRFTLRGLDIPEAFPAHGAC